MSPVKPDASSTIVVGRFPIGHFDGRPVFDALEVFFGTVVDRVIFEAAEAAITLEGDPHVSTRSLTQVLMLVRASPYLEPEVPTPTNIERDREVFACVLPLPVQMAFLGQRRDGYA
jgi:hypothetical protein